ncbi:MAG TPA: hypothetical protein VIH99_00155 [Bdellovibrionota bacterium]|jgi:hypothetical protein
MRNDKIFTQKLTDVFLCAGALLLVSSVAFPSSGFAEKYVGRATVGGYFANETFQNNPDGPSSNDFATVSSRLYTRYWDVTDSKLECTFDLADKHDFYDKLAAERLALRGRNSVQVKQLAVKRANPEDTWLFTGGRFPVPEAGTVNVDGVDVSRRWNPVLRSSLFGGLDPKLAEQTYFEFNKNAFAYGTYTTYQPESGSRSENIQGSAAFVGKQVGGHLDRLYLYNFFLYEWNSPNRILGMLYLDFVPRTYVQTGLLSYTTKFHYAWQATLQGLAIDVLEYSRRRGILETLPSSAYKEASLALRQEVDESWGMDYLLLHGERETDKRKFDEFSAGPGFRPFFDENVAANFKAGYRQNFTSNDYFLKFDIGYYPSDWELSLAQSIASQNDGQVTHPLITELNVAHFFSRELYGNFALQYAKSENAKVNSFFLFVGYRFGTSSPLALRKGAPPRGRQ